MTGERYPEFDASGLPIDDPEDSTETQNPLAHEFDAVGPGYEEGGELSYCVNAQLFDVDGVDELGEPQPPEEVADKPPRGRTILVDSWTEGFPGM